MDVVDINTCYPAKIESYDPVTQMATCRIQVEDYYTGLDYSFRKQDASLLIDVPVMIPQAGGWMLTFPIKAGDDCLVLFAQKGYDHWLYSGASETGLLGGRPTPEHYREFDLRDAICIVGIRPIPRAIPNYNPEDCELRNEGLTHRLTLKANGDIEMHTDTDIKVTANKVSVDAKAEVTVKAPSVKVDTDMLEVKSPMSKFSGSITVGGGISMGGGARNNVCDIKGIMRVTGTGTFQGDVTAMGKSVATHTHTGNQGAPTSPPL